VASRILQRLSRRERQVLEAIYRLGQGSVRDVQDELPDPPGYSAVRTHLRILTEKGFLRHEQVGRRYIYHPTVGKEEARRSALRSLLDTFFDGSVTATLSTLLEEEDLGLSDQELARMEALIRRARGRGEG
jgi:BlaI family transcriptional regulator, penicillinase repressor